jgi:hypothetical protein
MTHLQSQDHPEFENLTSGLEDYETLPEINTHPDITPLLTDEAQTKSLEEQILARLVSP